MKEFFAYIRVCCGYGNTRYAKRGFWNVETVLIIISALLVGGVIMCLNSSAAAETVGSSIRGNAFIYIAVYVYLMALLTGVARRNKPSLLTLFPISYEKRAVYAHLAVLLSGLLFTAAWILFMFAIMLFISVVALIFTGEWVFLLAFEQKAGLTAVPDVQGVLFVTLVIILLFGASMAISYIRNKKVRYSMFFVCPAVFSVFSLLIANLSSVEGKFVISNNMLLNFKNLPLSWLWLVVLAVIALGICAVSVCLALKYEKPKDY